MFEVLHTQGIVQDFPLLISCLDHLQQKLFIGTTDGSILDYTIEEEPFTITLQQVHKNIRKQIHEILILSRSRQLAMISNGGIYFGEMSTMNLVPLEKVKDVRSMARSPFEQSFDTLAIGLKRGIAVYQITAYEMIEGPTIKLPSTPIQMQFLSANRIIYSAQKGVYMVDIGEKSWKKIFSVHDPLFQKSVYMASFLLNPFSRYIVLTRQQANRLEITETEVETVYCNKDLDCYRVHLPTKESTKIFSWSTKPAKFIVDDYYAVGLLESTVELRSLKSGNLLQQFSLENCNLFSFEEIIYAASPNHVWRLLPLDFDDQIDDLLANNRFIDAEALLEELDFSSEEEKRQNVIKVKGVYAQHLFYEQKKYSEAIGVLEELKASPLDIVELYPDIIDENIQEKSDKVALKELGLYLSKERLKLSQFNNELSKKLVKDNSLISMRSVSTTERLEHSLHDSKQLLEFVETALLQVYLATNSPLLGALLRIENHCNYDRTVALLQKHEKFTELVDFYCAKKEHEKALLLLKSISKENEFDQVIEYLVRLDMNTDLDIIFKFSKEAIEFDPKLGFKIFTDHYQDVEATNRRSIYEYLKENSMVAAKLYLEFLVIKNQDHDVPINTFLFQLYLEEAKSKDPNSVKILVNFILNNNFYDPEIALLELPSQEFLYERSHILAKLHRHGESLDIFVSKLQDLKAANEYCEKYYRRNDPKSDYLFTMLFELQHAKGIKNVTDTLEYLNSHGYRMDSEFVYTVNKAVELLEHSLELPRLDSFLKQNVKSVLSLRYQEMARENLFKNYIMTVLFID